MLVLTGVFSWLLDLVPAQVEQYYRAARDVYLTPWFWGFTFSLLVIEWIRPGVKTQKVLSRGLAQDFVWFNFDIALRVTVLPAYVGMLQVLYETATGGYTIAALLPWPLPVKIVVAVVVFDFLQWTNHFVRHKVPVFWHFHAVHHSQRELNTFTDLRIHAVEYCIAETLAFMPMLTLGLPALAVMGVGGFRMWYARFVHANIGTNLGLLKYFVVTPQYHRIHHSIVPAHRDKNLGVLFTVWDRMFGTLIANYDEYPATGVIGLEFDPPRTFAPAAWVRDFLRIFFHPFRALKASATRKTAADAAASHAQMET